MSKEKVGLRLRLLTPMFEWPVSAQNWEDTFNATFYEGLYGLAESDGEYYDAFEDVKAFIRKLLERQK